MKKNSFIEAKYKKWFNSLDKTIVKLFNALIGEELYLVVNADGLRKMVLKKSLEEWGFTSDNISFFC